MNTKNVIDRTLVENYIKNGLVSKKKHPIFPIYILTYTRKVELENLWDNYIIMFRGLVVDENYVIISKPFPKFFNIEQAKSFPPEPYEITEKMDGVFITVFNYKGNRVVTSKSSFESDFVKKAEEILDKRGLQAKLFQRGFTYLFELVSPISRIVINYGSVENLYCITVINNNTNGEIPYNKLEKDIRLQPVVRRYSTNILNLYELKEIDNSFLNREGFVVRFINSNTRYKVKFTNYVENHKAFQILTLKRIWRYLSEGKESELTEYTRDKYPPFRNWVYKKIEYLKEQFQTVSCICDKKVEYDNFESDQEAYTKYKDDPMGNILIFKRKKNNHRADNCIWKYIKPKTKITYLMEVGSKVD